jgi:hypothetical protein
MEAAPKHLDTPALAESGQVAEPASDRVDRIFAEAELPAELVARRSGRRIRLEPDADGERLLICTAEGEVELSVRLTPEGPVLRLTGTRVELAADQLALRCRELDIDVGEAAAIRARSIGLEATLGNISLRANDDVEVEGERIWLNR